MTDKKQPEFDQMDNTREPEFNSLSHEESLRLLADPDSPVEAENRMKFVDTGPSVQQSEHVLEEEAPGEDVTDWMLQTDSISKDSWLQYNKGLEQTGYSPADRINKDNVEGLSRAYVIPTDGGGMQTNPLIVPGDPPVMYFNTTTSKVKAVNARTGDLFWEHQYDYSASRRTVAVSGNKVYAATNESVMLAYNRYTGEKVWETNYLWDEDLPEGMGEYPQVHSGTSAGPIVYDGMLFTGMVSGGVQWSAVTAMDAESGEIQWRTPNVNPDGWIGDVWAYGSSNSWMPPTIDPQSKTLLFTVGDPSSFWKTTHRPGPNKHSVSIRAFSFDGENKWNHQHLAHEMWDYDCCSTVSVVDAVVDGEERRVVISDEKSGWSDVIDIETGRLIQRSEPLGIQEHRHGSWPDSEYLNYVEIGEENAGVSLPHATGLAQWPTDAYSPRTNMRYIGVQEWGQALYADEENWLEGVEYTDTTPANRAGGSAGFADYGPRTACVAIDVDTGEKAWEFEYPDEGPTWPGGPTATGGGIVFGPAKDGMLIAFDDEDGDVLWSDDTGGGLTASPVVWDDPVESTQYVAIASNDRIVAYSLETS